MDDSGPACACGVPLQQSARGRRRLYCSDVCRQRAARIRRTVPVVEVPVVGVPVVAQVERAVLEARSVGFAFQRLGRDAPPALGGRCRDVGAAIVDAVGRAFPGVG